MAKTVRLRVQVPGGWDAGEVTQVLKRPQSGLEPVAPSASGNFSVLHSELHTIVDVSLYVFSVLSAAGSLADITDKIRQRRERKTEPDVEEPVVVIIVGDTSYDLLTMRREAIEKMLGEQ